MSSESAGEVIPRNKNLPCLAPPHWDSKEYSQKERAERQIMLPRSTRRNFLVKYGVIEFECCGCLPVRFLTRDRSIVTYCIPKRDWRLYEVLGLW